MLIEGDARADAVRTAFNRTLLPLGKLLPAVRWEELAECNGQDGSPLWISIEIDIFDIRGKVDRRTAVPDFDRPQNFGMLHSKSAVS
jgi:hypothetical protein